MDVAKQVVDKRMEIVLPLTINSTQSSKYGK